MELRSIEKSIPAAYSDLLEYDITISFDSVDICFCFSPRLVNPTAFKA
jgi:hypothetical protein